jgi:hypothetical protein
MRDFVRDGATGRNGKSERTANEQHCLQTVGTVGASMRAAASSLEDAASSRLTPRAPLVVVGIGVNANFVLTDLPRSTGYRVDPARSTGPPG